MPGKYASGTSVTPGRSRDEIERLLRKYGATTFGYVDQGDKGAVAFEMRGRRFRFYIRFPDMNEFKLTPTGKERSATSRKDAYDQAVREVWRSMVLIVKAKLEAIENGVRSFEEEWMANVIMPNGMTVEEWLEPQLAEAYSTGRMPPLLPMPGQ